jgi:hypothetical protein
MGKIKQKSPPGNLGAEISRRALKKMDVTIQVVPPKIAKTTEL